MEKGTESSHQFSLVEIVHTATLQKDTFSVARSMRFSFAHRIRSKSPGFLSKSIHPAYTGSVDCGAELATPGFWHPIAAGSIGRGAGLRLCVASDSTVIPCTLDQLSTMAGSSGPTGADTNSAGRVWSWSSGGSTSSRASEARTHCSSFRRSKTSTPAACA